MSRRNPNAWPEGAGLIDGGNAADQRDILRRRNPDPAHFDEDGGNLDQLPKPNGQAGDPTAHEWYEGTGPKTREDSRPGAHLIDGLPLVRDHASGRNLTAHPIDQWNPEPIVRASSNEFNAFSYTVPVLGTTGAQPIQVTGKNDRRSMLKLLVAGTSAIVLGRLSNVTSGQGFTLPPGIVFEPTISDELYAIVVVGGTPSILSVWTEDGRR